MFKDSKYRVMLLLLVSGAMLWSGAKALGQVVGGIQDFGPNLQSISGGVCRQPEGLIIDPAGNLYAASNSDSATVGHVCVFSPGGTLTNIIDIPSGTSGVIGLLGELWDRGQLYLLDQADNNVPNGRILKVNPQTHAVSTIANGFAFPNGIVRDGNDQLFVSDSLLGRIYKLSPDGSNLTVWIDSPQLRSSNPDLPVGANGLAFDRTRGLLYVANTGDRRIFRIPVGLDGTAGALGLFADGAAIDLHLGLAGPVALFGADGIQFDVQGNLYVAANHANEIQVYSSTAELIHRYVGLGDAALDFPASLAFRGRELYITNMSAADGGIHSKLSIFEAPFRGLRSR